MTISIVVLVGGCHPIQEAPVTTIRPAHESVEPAASMSALIAPVLVPPRSMAGMTTEDGVRPLSRAVVFYQVPVNIDSLSADAIVKRFGVSQAVADLIVRERAVEARP